MFLKKEEASMLDSIVKKIKRQENAVHHQLKRYQQCYRSRSLPEFCDDNFIRMARQLKTLMVSHCQNVLTIGPESAAKMINQLGELVDDVISKYQDLSVKCGGDRLQNSKEGVKAVNFSQLCAVCSQHMNKIQVDRLRSQLLHEDSLHNYKHGDDASKTQEEDLLFFAEVNNLLTSKQGEILKNQRQIGEYHKLALSSLNILLSIEKDFINRQAQPQPNRSWINEAKQEMELLLKEYFSGKIPPWIQKMLDLFYRLHNTNQMEKKREAGVQTESHANSEVFELRKKNVMSTRKIDEYQTLYRERDKQLELVENERELLQSQIGYYRKQIQELMNQLDQLKKENQQITVKLNNNRLRKTQENGIVENGMTQTHIEDSDSMIDIIGTMKSIKKKMIKDGSQRKIFPRIQVISSHSAAKRKSKQSRRNTKESRTSLTIDVTKRSSPQVSQHSGKRVKLQQKDSGVSSTSRDEITNSNLESRRVSNRSDHSVSSEKGELFEIHGKDSKNIYPNLSSKMIIHQVEDESNLEEERKKIKKVSQQLKEMIKLGLNRKVQQKGRSSMPLPVLKKTVRKPTYQQISEVKQQSQRNGTVEMDTPETVHEDIGSIFNELKEKGYLIKVSEQEFKSIMKIKTCNFGGSQHSTRTDGMPLNVQRLQGRNKKFQQLAATRREWNKMQFSPQMSRTASPSLHSQPSYHQDYQILFTDQKNAFNYQSSLTKNHSKAVYSMNKTQKQLCRQFYDKISFQRHQNSEHYKFICGYLRYPFQMMQGNMGIMPANQMKFNNFQYYFQRIMAIHTSCKKKEGLCQHLRVFKAKILDKNHQI